MGLISLTKSKKVFLDTNPFIYFFEHNSAFYSTVKPIFLQNKNGENFLQTSLVTLSEILVKPIRDKNEGLIESYQQKLSSSKFFEMGALSELTAIIAAELRSINKLKLADAFQLASAIEMDSDIFLTNDGRLKRTNLKKPEILVIEDFVQKP